MAAGKARTWGSRATARSRWSWVGVAALGVALGGCGPRTGKGCPTPCAPVFEVDDWCWTHPGKCTIDGAASASCSGGCSVVPGKTLRVPVSMFADQLSGRHDLGMSWAGGIPHLSAVLDGVAGTALPAIQDETHLVDGAFMFSPFPSSPKLLEASFNNNDTKETTVLFWAIWDFHGLALSRAQSRRAALPHLSAGDDGFADHGGSGRAGPLGVPSCRPYALPPAATREKKAEDSDFSLTDSWARRPREGDARAQCRPRRRIDS